MKKLIPAFILVIALSLYACSSAQEAIKEPLAKARGSASTISAALAAAEKHNSYRIDGEIKISSTAGNESFDATISIEGISSYDGKNSDITTEISGFGDSIPGMTLNSFVTKQKIVDGVVYMQLPNLFGNTQSDKWVKQSYQDFFQSEDDLQQDPTEFLRYLEAVSDDIETIGKEKVNGKNTTHYKAMISADALTERYEDEETKRYYDELGITDQDYNDLADNLPFEEIPFEVWITDDHEIARIAMTMEATETTIASETINMSLVFNFSDWGTDVNVQAPSADQIVTEEQYYQDMMGDLLGNESGLGGLLGGNGDVDLEALLGDLQLP